MLDNSFGVGNDSDETMGEIIFNQSTEEQILLRFGKKALRPGQRELIVASLAGKNVLGILPTGYGKSLCYQTVAELLGGTSVVVSPLIALMRDQVQSLLNVGIAAARFDSTLEIPQRKRLLDSIAAGQIRILFVAPESLENAALQAALQQTQRNLFVVDEAHCVSEWGYSFRPDYLKLPHLLRNMQFRNVMAITATATVQVQHDLCRLFSIEAADVYSISPYRANIMRNVVGVEDKLSYISSFLQAPQHRPAVVYTRTRATTEAVAAALLKRGFHAVGYHAGIKAETRECIQDAFLHNTKDVLVATIAFGMGIDKPDVRAVIHYDEPTSPEAYLQESGRAGRDGQECSSLVLMSEAGRIDAQNRIYAAEPDVEGVLRAVRWLLPQGKRCVSLWELGTSCDVPDDVALRALWHLEQAGAVRLIGKGYKYYKAKPLFAFSVIADGRDAEEVARLCWLNTHPEGEIEAAADAWNCSFAEALLQLRECEEAGEWNISFRQQAVYIESLNPKEPKAIANDLSEAYARRRDGDLLRYASLCDILSTSPCINAALEMYFTGAAMQPCGHCSACRGEKPVLQPLPPCPELPPDADLPEFYRQNQRKRFLLGIASPGLNARRLWSHPYYGAAAGTRWNDL